MWGGEVLDGGEGGCHCRQGRRGFLDARPGQVDVEEEEEDAEADYGRLYVKKSVSPLFFLESYSL